MLQTLRLLALVAMVALLVSCVDGGDDYYAACDTDYCAGCTPDYCYYANMQPGELM